MDLFGEWIATKNGMLDTLLVMSVEPGFGGQSFIADVLSKVRRARELVDAGELRLLVEIDGGINADTIEQAAEDVVLPRVGRTDRAHRDDLRTFPGF